MSMAYERFLTLFPQAPREKAGKGVRVLCPAHNDRDPSLWVEPPSSDTFTVDFKCLAGCKREAILDALKLTWADVRMVDSKQLGPTDWRVTDSFVYELETGREYYIIDRQENGTKKKFRAKRKVNGKYVFNLEGLTPVLYKLPELRKAVKAGKTILLPEGEGKVDLVRGLGFEGTTNPYGANKWDDRYTKELAGADVVILPDYDKTGLDFVEQKARALHGIAKRVRILQLAGVELLKGNIGKEGVDVVNWLEAGHTKQEFQELVDSAPEWTPKEGEPAPVEDLAGLLDDVEDNVGQYVATGEAERTALALWVAHTHAFDAAESTPYMAINSPEKRSGKTRLLEVLELLVRRPWFTGRTTAAALARKVDKDCPTLLLDESDAAFKGDKDYSETLRSILNTGHRRGGKVTVCVGQGANLDFRDFSTFCPKAIAGIGKLPDTVSDRSISIVLKRRAPNEHIERFRHRDAAVEAAPLRDSLTRWAIQAIPALRDARPDIPPELDDRAADGWEPLLAIADAAGGDWPQKARAAAIALSCGEQREDQSLGTRLLADIKTIFDDRGMDRLPSGELVKALNNLEEAPWSDLDRRPLDATRMARLLRPYGVKPKTIRVGETTVKGYERAQFTDAWERYTLPCIPLLPVTPVTPASSQVQSPTRNTDREPKANVTAAAQLQDRYDVTAVTAGSGGQEGGATNSDKDIVEV